MKRFGFLGGIAAAVAAPVVVPRLPEAVPKRFYGYSIVERLAPLRAELAELDEPMNIMGKLPAMLARSENLTLELINWNRLNWLYPFLDEEDHT